jgi:chromosome partitioning protein
VGKTTLCINLAYSLAKRGWRTLLVDTDPQGGVGLSLAKSTRSKAGFHEFVVSGRSLKRLILATRMPELQILPSGQYDACVRHGWPSHEVPGKLKDLLRDAELRGMDCVLIDTAAGMSGLTESVIKASDYLLIPQQAEPLAVRSVPHLLETLTRFRSEGAGVKLAGILLTMVMSEHAMSLKVARELREMLPPELMFKQSVPRLASFLEASGKGIPLALLKRKPPPEALIFDQIAAELEERVGLGHQQDSEDSHASLLD